MAACIGFVSDAVACRSGHRGTYEVLHLHKFLPRENYGQRNLAWRSVSPVGPLRGAAFPGTADGLDGIFGSSDISGSLTRRENVLSVMGCDATCMYKYMFMPQQKKHRWRLAVLSPPLFSGRCTYFHNPSESSIARWPFHWNLAIPNSEAYPYIHSLFPRLKCTCRLLPLATFFVRTRSLLILLRKRCCDLM